MKLDKGPVYKRPECKEIKKKEESEEFEKPTEATGDKKEKKDARVTLVTHVNKVLPSVFSNVDVYINNQQTYNSYGLYLLESYISNSFEAANFDYKGYLQRNGFDHADILGNTIKTAFFNPFSTGTKMLRRLDDFVFYGTLELKFPAFLRCPIQT